MRVHEAQLPFEALKALEGQTIARVLRVPCADQGVRIELGNGDVLDIGYSSCEGSTKLNGNEVNDDSELRPEKIS